MAARSDSDRVEAAGLVTLGGEIQPEAEPNQVRRGPARFLIQALGARPLLGASITAGVLISLMGIATWVGVGDAPSPRARSVAVKGRADASLTGLQPETAADPAFRLQDLGPSEAEIYNAGVPVSDEPNPAAKPFHLKSDNPQDAIRAAGCLTAAVYYEAASEPLDGQRAVAQVVLNRLRDLHYPKTVCGVVFQGVELPTGWQFTFVGDGSLARKPSAQGWATAHQVAVAALNGYVETAVGEATHYHTVWVAPYWSPSLLKVANIGAHIFYRWAGGMGMPRAFSGQYAGAEPFLAQLAALDPAVLDAKVEAAAPRLELSTTEINAPVAPTPEAKASVQLAEAAARASDPARQEPSPGAAKDASAPAPAIVTTLPTVQTHAAPPPPPHPWSRLPTGSGF